MFFFAVRNHSDGMVNEPFAVLLFNSQSLNILVIKMAEIVKM